MNPVGLDSEVVAHNLGMAAELGRVVRALREACVPCIVLKGVPLCERIHESLAAHAIADNDILVHRADLAVAIGALRPLGYAAIAGRNAEQDLEEGFEHPLVRSDVDGRPVFCEIHWNAFPPSLFRVEEGILWDRTMEVDVFGVRVRVFDPVLQVLHLASHAVQHDLCEPRTLTVFGRAWSHWQPEIDVDALTELATRIGIEHVLEYMVVTARAFGLTSGGSYHQGSRRAAVVGKLLGTRVLEPAEHRYPERYVRATAVAALVPTSRAISYLLERAWPAPEWLVRQRGPAAVALHYAARPFRPLLRSLGWTPGSEGPTPPRAAWLRARATRDYLRIYRSLERRYEEQALDALLSDLESEPEAPSRVRLPLTELVRVIRAAERLAPRLSSTPNTCLFRALTRYALLEAHVHRPSFVLGVAEPFERPGHAWVEVGGEPFLEPGTPQFARILTRESPLPTSVGCREGGAHSSPR